MVRCNLHTHTTFCDGKNTPREMADAAIECGMDTLGFSGHSFTDFDDSFCLREPLKFAEAIKELKKEYEGRLHILLGAEADFYGEVPYECEYTIGAVHYVKAKGIYYPIDHTARQQNALYQDAYGGDVLSGVAAYYDTVAEMAAALKPSLVAHFDVITKFNQKEGFFDERGEEYLTLALNAVDAVLENCPVIEINTGGMFRGYRTDPYPALPILSRIKERGGDVILSSDSHCTQALNHAFDRGVELARQAGFDRLLTYTPRGIEYINIQGKGTEKGEI